MRKTFLPGGAVFALAWGCSSTVTVLESASSAGGAASVSQSASVASTGTGNGAAGPVTSTTVSVGTGGMGGMPACVPTTGPTLEAAELYLGDSDWSGQKSNDAWQLFGRNVDGKSFDKNNTIGHCKLHAGAPASVAYDAPNGVDNSFGRHFIPLLESVSWQSPAANAKTFVQNGFTVLLELAGLGNASDKSPLIAAYYVGSKNINPLPKFDGSDCLRLDSYAGVPAALFTSATIVGNHFNSLTPVTLKFPLHQSDPYLWQPFYLTIHQATISVVLSADHQSGKLGIVSGVLDREQFIEAYRQLQGGGSKGLCSGSAWDATAEQLRQFADVMVDGTQDANKECNGISIGIGFTMVASGLGQTGPYGGPPTPCQ